MRKEIESEREERETERKTETERKIERDFNHAREQLICHSEHVSQPSQMQIFA